jgi:hypothetical protein
MDINFYRVTGIFNNKNIILYEDQKLSTELIDFLRLPRPHGERRTEHKVRARRSQNQFTPFGDGVNKLIFKRFAFSYS